MNIFQNIASKTSSNKQRIKKLFKVIEVKEQIIFLLKLIVGVIGMVIAGINKKNSFSIEKQQNDLDDYHIFIAAYFVIEALDYAFDSLSEKQVKLDKKSNKEIKFVGKISIKRTFIARMYSLIPMLLYMAVFIAGFVMNDQFKENRIQKYIDAENQLYMQYKNTTLNQSQIYNNQSGQNRFLRNEMDNNFAFQNILMESQTKLIETGEDTNNSSQQTATNTSLQQNETQYSDSRSLVESFNSEYKTFTALTILVFVENLYSFIFPQSFLKITFLKDFQLHPMVYNLLFNLLTPIIALIVSLSFNSVTIEFFIGDNEELLPYQLSNIVSKEFSTGAETLFLMLHFLDIILTTISAYMMWCCTSYYECCTDVEEYDGNKETNCRHSVPSFINIFTNMGLAVVQFLVAAYLIKNAPLSRKSPIYLFIFSLLVEGVDNTLDTIAFIIYFIDQVDCKVCNDCVCCILIVLLICCFWPLILLYYILKFITLKIQRESNCCRKKNQRTSQTQPQVDQNETPQPILPEKMTLSVLDHVQTQNNDQSGPNIQQQEEEVMIVSEKQQEKIHVAKKIDNETTLNSNQIVKKTNKMLKPVKNKHIPLVTLPAINAHKNIVNRAWTLTKNREDDVDQDSNDP